MAQANIGVVGMAVMGSNLARNLASHGHLSSSVSGTPAAILSTLVIGCRSSASRNRTPSRSARRAPTVDLPDPLTPMTTTSGGWGIHQPY